MLRSNGCSWNERPQSVGEYINAVEQIRCYWRPKEHQELWFRGEREAHHCTRLSPQLYRPREGVSLKPVSELLDIEYDLFEEFTRCGAQLGTFQPEDDWDWYFLMQHHGAPTRIIDWSDGALIGLHFAVKGVEREENCRVFVLQPYLLLDHLKALPDYDLARARWIEYIQKHPSEEYSESEWDFAYLPDGEWRDEVPLPNIPLLWDTAHFTRRVGAQRSRFMMFGTEPLWMQRIADEQEWVKMLTIEASSISRIKHELRDAGITESVIFPDLDGLGRELKQLWDWRR